MKFAAFALLALIGNAWGQLSGPIVAPSAAVVPLSNGTNSFPPPSPSPALSPSPVPVPVPVPVPLPNPSPIPTPVPSPSPIPSPVPVPQLEGPPPPPALGPVPSALMSFKNSITNADSVPSFSNWGTGSYCEWTGVICDSAGLGTVIGLNLSGQNPPLTGVLPDALADTSLATLQMVDLSNNQLSGNISEAFNANGTLPNLITWDMQNNNLTGGVANLGTNGLQSLQILRLDGNQFAQLPDAWRFSAMNLLYINNNQLNVPIPESWSSVVPAGKIVIILPQATSPGICGSLPNGSAVRWVSLIQNSLLQLTALPVCPSPPPPSPVLPIAPPPFPTRPSPSRPKPSPSPKSSPPFIPIAFPPPPPRSQGGLSTPVIVGIAVGGAVGLVAILTLFCWCTRRASKGSKVNNMRKDSQYGPKGPKEEDSLEDSYLESGFGGSPKTGGNDDLAGSNLYKQNSNGQATMLIGPDMIQDWARLPRNDVPGNDSMLPKASIAADPALASLGGMRPPVHRRTGSRGSQLPVDVKLWTLNFKDMIVERQIGEGSFGRVYVAKWNETMVAVKVLIGVGTMEEEEDDGKLTLSNPVLNGLAKESTMMAALRHPNVVGFLGVCLSPPCIVTEYCARGSLTDVLRGGKSSSAKAALLDWPRRLNMALDAAKGMLYLHAHAPPIIHRDLKSPNLLVDRHWRVKVSDFNLSKLLDEGSVMSSMAATNPRWLAPEILTGNNATFSSDVYSFAIVMWELLTWELPWGPTNPWQIVTMVTEGRRLEVPSRDALPGPDTSSFDGLDSYVSLMVRCWAHAPESRPSFQEIIAELRYLLSNALAKAGRMPASTMPAPTTMSTIKPMTLMRTNSVESQTKVYSPTSPTSNAFTETATETATEAATSAGKEAGFGPVGRAGHPPAADYSSTTVQAASLLDIDDLDHR